MFRIMFGFKTPDLFEKKKKSKVLFLSHAFLIEVSEALWGYHLFKGLTTLTPGYSYSRCYLYYNHFNAMVLNPTEN